LAPFAVAVCLIQVGCGGDFFFSLFLTLALQNDGVKETILNQQLRQLLYRFLVSPLRTAGCGTFQHRCQILPCGTSTNGQHTAAVHADCHVPLYENLRTVVQFAVCTLDSTTPGVVPEHCTVHATGIPA